MFPALGFGLFLCQVNESIELGLRSALFSLCILTLSHFTPPRISPKVEEEERRDAGPLLGGHQQKAFFYLGVESANKDRDHICLVHGRNPKGWYIVDAH